MTNVTLRLIRWVAVGAMAFSAIALWDGRAKAASRSPECCLIGANCGGSDLCCSSYGCGHDEEDEMVYGCVPIGPSGCH
jgi:hypothetical protein